MPDLKKDLDSEGLPNDSGARVAARPPSPAVLARVLSENPEHVSLAEAARLLKLGKTSVSRYWSGLVDKTVEGITLYRRDHVLAAASAKGRRQKHRMTFEGIDIERIQRICERYYRQNFDTAPTELKVLAKKVAKL